MTETTEAFKPSTYEPVEGTPADPEVQHEARTQRRIDPDGTLHMMTEIGDGVFVQWSQCARCFKLVGDCKDAGGPVEPEYMQRWRTQRFAKSFAERGIDPRATPYVVRELLAEAQVAANAACGDSNDDEIDLLRGVAESALALLGLRMPQGHDPDDEPDEDDAEEGEGIDVTDSAVRASTVFERPPGNVYDVTGLVDQDDQALGDETDAIDNGFDAALAAARAKKENPDVGF